jgi:DNA-binding GntR family transcriptional regulator
MSSEKVGRLAVTVTGETQDLAPGVGMTGLDRCVESIRAMIFSGVLLPGQKVHQAELAQELNVSRVPVREALSRLHAEGLLVHRSNAGFTVARFNREELSEIYLMRRVLETQLLRTMPLERVDLSKLEEINAELREISPRDSPDIYQKLNIRFHFTIFAASPLELVATEVERLWNMSAYYRSARLFVTHDPSQLCAEHDLIIEAIRNGDVDALVRVTDQHRSGTEQVDSWLRGHSLPGSD